MGAMDGRSFQAIGTSMRRKEDHRLLAGKGQFGDDFAATGQCHAAMVRSPHPHARIAGIDTQAARRLPGVLGIFTGADCRQDGLATIPHNPVPSTQFDMKLTAPGGGKVFIGPHALLPIDRARYAGEAVAMVVAETAAQAMDAAEAVEIAYEELPFVVATEAALAGGAPAVWDEVPDNVFVDTVFGDVAGTDRAFAAATHVVAMSAHIARITPAPIEPRAGLAEYDAETGRYTLHFCSGGPGVVRQKREMAAVLGLEPEQLRLVSYDSGGSFGVKNRTYVEFGLILWAARKIGRPIKYVATRSESMMTDYQARDLVTDVELALAADGRFLALRASNISNAGAHAVSLSPLAKGSGLVTGSYDIPVATMRARAVFTNTTPTNVMRSSGRPEVTFAIERLIDKAAAELGFDRVALRRQNLVPAAAMPYTNAVGSRYDSGEYEANMDLAMRIADWDGFEQRRSEAASRGKLLGLGLANYVESSTGSPKERAEITIRPEGRVTIVIGAQPSGQGHETSLSQIVADLLAVPSEAIDIVMGDTDIVSEGGGSHSGRSMRHAATVLAMAATELISKGRNIAARLLQTDPDEIAFSDGKFTAPGNRHRFDFLDLAREAKAHDLPERLAIVTDNEMHESVFPNGCAVCEVEIDPETGWVHPVRYANVDDVGRCINPMTVDGQTHGCIAHGIGEALSEQCYVDPATGQTLTGSFADYGIPLSDRLPLFTTEIVEILSPTNPLGIKSGSEGATTAAPAAIINAIIDALSGLGITEMPMPATPLAVWQAIQAAKVRRSRAA
jgi:carbon-monoxide dehydrogenase large subunit